MDYSREEVYEMIDELKGHDDVIGHSSYRWFGDPCAVLREDHNEDI